MALISLNDITVGFGGPPILDNIDMQIARGERVCLLGRNGTGKTTLMKVIAGEIQPQGGYIAKQPNLKITTLTQEVPKSMPGTVFEVIVGGHGKTAEMLKEYHRVSTELTETGSEELIKKLDTLHHSLEAAGSWHVNTKTETIISQLKLDADAKFDTLSAGLKRRTLLARALVIEPDILMLDEPTNHLDIDSIAWLEEFLKRNIPTLLFVTHDRMFMRNLSTRIIDIDRGSLSSWTCDYDSFIKHKQQALGAEAKHNSNFDKKLAEEEVWIRKGIKARRVRNEGRVTALKNMRNLRSERRELAEKVKMETQDVQQSGMKVIDAINIGFAYPDSPPIIEKFSTTILRQDRIGIIGPNGSGKTTLINVLLKKLKNTQGKVKHGTNLEIAYFDQLHEQLDEEKTVWENVGEGYNSIEFNGRKRNVIGYLQDFLFPPQQSKNLVSTLSGGERNRLLLAKLFSKPANLLILDEPTNDLDIETLDLLEELLLDFKGTVLMVSHDREFINNVVTSTLVLEGMGKVKEYAGGYDDWLRQTKINEPQQIKKPKQKPEAQGYKKPNQKPKLTYKLQKELDSIPEKIDRLESQLAELHTEMANPDFYKKTQPEIAATAEKTEMLQKELNETFKRWEELEELQ
ncbi:MAG: ATP-binding cassette domain-containing protein [Planctomycetes bacterium]|nr:ATP-binding cassette domain-containing protein [Planctomycetota bacterium]